MLTRCDVQRARRPATLDASSLSCCPLLLRREHTVREAQRAHSSILTFLAFIPPRTKPKQRKPYCLNKIGFLLSPPGSSLPHRAVRSRAVSRGQRDHTCILHQRQLCASARSEFSAAHGGRGALAFTDI